MSTNTSNNKPAKSKKKSAELEDYDPKKAYDAEPYFALIDLYFETNKQILVKHHISSYNQFIEEIIPSILQRNANMFYEKITENKIIRYRLTYSNLGLEPAYRDEVRMYPIDAIQKNLYYAGKYVAKITQYQDIIDINTGETETRIIASEDNVEIAQIPIMVGSKYCNLVLEGDPLNRHCKYDLGGYFIANGGEKVGLTIETIVKRKPMVTIKKEQNVITYTVKVQSRPSSQFSGSVQNISIKIKKGSVMVADAQPLKDIPVFILMRALGLETDNDIVNAILDPSKDKILMNQLIVFMNSQNNPPMTKEIAIDILSGYVPTSKHIYYDNDNAEIKFQQKRKYLLKILSQQVLPHITSNTNNLELDMLHKAHYIGYMINKLLKCYVNRSSEVEDLRGCDDRDSMANKRGELIGDIFGGIFDQMSKKALSEYNKIFKQKNKDDKKPLNIIYHIKPNIFTHGLKKLLVTGATDNNNRKGIVQPLNRTNYLHSVSYMRKVVTPLADASNNKLTGPRSLHNSQYGTVCPFETPDGPKTGTVKNMSMTSSVTIAVNSQIPIIKAYLKDKLEVIELNKRKNFHGHVTVFLDNNPLGYTKNIIKIHEDLRKKRSKGEIEQTVSLVFNYKDKEFRIYTEGNRFFRPLLTVTNNEVNFKPEMLKGIKTWNELLSKYPHIIEFIDKEEEENVMLAIFPYQVEEAKKIMDERKTYKPSEIDKINRTNRYDGCVYPRFTHLELHPSMILGLITSNIPFSDHNQSPRGIFQFSQARHSMGFPISNYRNRTDISYVMYHPQLPIVASRVAKYTGSNIFPAGENLMVAVAAYSGYNQEDSLIMNKSANQKGMMVAQSLQKAYEPVKKNPSSSHTGIFMKPEPNKVDSMKDANYNKLNESGYVDTETVVVDNDVIIGLVSPKAIVKKGERPYKDNATLYKSVVPGTIDKVITDTNGDGYAFIKMRIRSERIPEIGDKFSCYDEKTQVLTSTGWINFSQLQPTHKVASLDPTTDLIKYTTPSAIQKYPYEGQMYSVKSNNINLMVTPNHNMWVNDEQGFKLIRADQLEEKKYIYKNRVSGIMVKNFTEEINQTILNYISNMLNKSTYTKMPEELLFLTRNDCKSILTQIMNSMRHMDGVVVCFGEDQANDISRLSLHVGFVCEVIKNRSGVFVVRIHEDEIVVDGDVGKYKNYKGFVYCCTVDTGIIYVRRKGIPCFSGNSRSGQKSTVGYNAHRADMMFTSRYIMDVILNPNAIPKRMTIGYLLEIMVAKVCAIKGTFGDATPFFDVGIEKLNEMLIEAGYEPWGVETAFDGATGLRLKTKIFCGPIYYQRLKQMVGDKIRSRTRGPTQMLTRAPTEGRTREGGLRFGEMERDGAIAHGISQFLKERTVDNSDMFVIRVCDMCGMLAHRALNYKHYVCTHCDNTTKISKAAIPYGLKLLFQELASINILARIVTEKSLQVI